MTPRRRRSDSAASPSRESRRPKHLGRKAESRQRAGHDESSRSATIEDGSEGFDDSTDREISPDSWSSDETNNVPLGAWPRGGEEGLTDWEQPETLYNEVGTIATEILHRRRIVATAATSALAKSPQPSRSALPLIAPALPKSLQRGLVLGVAQRLESLLASLAQEQEAARERHDEEKLIDASDVLEAVQRLRSGNVMSETLLARLSKIVEEFDVPAAAVDKAPSGTSDSSSSSVRCHASLIRLPVRFTIPALTRLIDSFIPYSKAQRASNPAGWRDGRTSKAS